MKNRPHHHPRLCHQPTRVIVIRSDDVEGEYIDVVGNLPGSIPKPVHIGGGGGGSGIPGGRPGRPPVKAVLLGKLTELMKSERCAFFDCVECEETLSCHVRSKSVAMDMDVCGIVHDMALYCVQWTHMVCGQSFTGISGIRCYTDSQWHQCPMPTGSECKHMPLHKRKVMDVSSYVVCRDALKTKISCRGAMCEEGTCQCA